MSATIGRGVILITRMILNTRRNFLMNCLYEQGPNPTDERRHVADHRPRNRLWTEQARIAFVLE